ncbi:hypothetical protein AAG570_001243 [Ranatra chinensis]|uniref:Uncharacterized protein n=1 Tax=Ranatra chinensis TaxID=642074 RepID=A0ABD0YZG2_9HEMI
MAPKRRNMPYENKKQEKTEIGMAIGHPFGDYHSQWTRSIQTDNTRAMKFLAVLFALCAITYAAHVQSRSFGNSIDDFVRELLEYVRKMMKEHEPLKVPDIPEQVINDNDSKI